MTKFTKLMKNSIYLKLVDPRKLMAMVGVTGSLFSSVITANIPAALAEEGTVNRGSAFLTVQPLTIDEKDDNEMALQNNVFFAVNNLAVAPIVKKLTAVKSSGQLAVRPAGAVVTVTAYSSTPDQTDDSPFITANGTYVRDGIVATNFLPFGTKVKFPEYSGDKVYTVEDRMAKKNNHKIDIWMPTRGAAINFGVKKLAYEVIE